MKNNDVSSSSSGDLVTSKSGSPQPTKKSIRELIAERRKKVLKESRGVLEMEIMDPYEAVSRYKNFQEKKTGFIEQESPGHHCLWDPHYPENPERVACAKRRLEFLGLLDRCQRIEPENVSEELFLRKHTKNLYEKLKNTSELSEELLQEESANWDSVYFSQETFQDAKLAAAAAVTLTLKVAKGDLKNGFALIRPPGHHAMQNAFCGYCFLNNVAISSEAAIAQGYAKKILIIDYDVHHGQATQRMFYDRNDVLYFSIHRYEHGTFWPNLRESDSDYIGEGKGVGYNINVPLNEVGLNEFDYLAIVFNILLPVAYEFSPDLILISAGYDAAIGCPEGQMSVLPHFYGHLISLLSGLANGKIAVCLEGGYFKESLAEGVVCTLMSLLGDVCYPIDVNPHQQIRQSLQEVINNVKFFLRDYWKCFQNEEFFEYPVVSPLNWSLAFNMDEEHVTVVNYQHVPVEIAKYPTSGFYPVVSDGEEKNFLSIIDNLRKEYSKGRVFSNAIGYVYDEEFLKHKPSTDTAKSPPEKPERLTEIICHFEEFGLKERLKKINPSQFDEILWVNKVHNNLYINSILSQEGLSEKPDWFYNEYTTKCIMKCVSSILSLAQSIDEGSVRAGVAVIRPPGHHAMSNNGSGFCFINNVVVVAEYLIQVKKHKRILIVDFDIHHGNGTQELTYGRSDIMYISVHRFDNGKFFPSRLEADFKYIGENEGAGFNVNIPFNKGSKTDIDYWTVWHKLVMPLAYSYNPDFIIVSAGFDAGFYDPLGGGYKVSPEMFGHFIQLLKSLASGKILLALEGGYNVKSTALSMTMCVKALLGDALPVPNFYEKITEDTLNTIRTVITTHRVKWPALQVNKKLANFSCTYQQKEKLKELLENFTGDSAPTEQIKEIVKQCKGSN